MVRRDRLNGSSAAAADRSGGDAIRLARLEFGEFPEITRLNPRFVPGLERLKLTLDVAIEPDRGARRPAALVTPLQDLLPGLARHLCCGGHRIHESFLPSAGRPGAEEVAGEGARDEAVDAAHLLEHILIDVSHYIADMKRCSGVTCGYESPRWRCDLFVESPGRGVSRLAVDIGLALMNALMAGAEPDPLYSPIVRLARHFHRHPFEPIAEPEAARVIGKAGGKGDLRDTGIKGVVDGAGSMASAGGARAMAGEDVARAALGALRASGFIREIETTMNFSRVAVYRLDGRRG